MKKLILISILFASFTGCSILTELTALSKCEFSFHSVQDPVIAGIDVSRIQSYADLSFLDGTKIVTSISQKQLPFGITANIEVKNPGPVTAAVNYIDWIAFIDDIQITTGRINERVEVLPHGGTSLIPVRIEADIFDFLKGDTPKAMLNFGLNLMDAGGQPTRISLKIKPSVNIGSAMIPFPHYFTITKEFSSGE